MATGHANIIEQIADPDVPLAQFRRLLKLEPSRSKPFTPSIGLDFGHAALARTADPFTPTGGAVGDAFTQRRQEQYRRRIAAGDTSLRFVAEGDSWFHYPIVLRDTLDWLSDSYAIFDLAAAGDTLENMKRGITNIIDVIEREESQGFLLSGGGNDLLEGNRLTLLLRPPIRRSSVQDGARLHHHAPTRRLPHPDHRRLSLFFRCANRKISRSENFLPRLRLDVAALRRHLSLADHGGARNTGAPQSAHHQDHGRSVQRKAAAACEQCCLWWPGPLRELPRRRG